MSGAPVVFHAAHATHAGSLPLTLSSSVLLAVLSAVVVSALFGWHLLAVAIDLRSGTLRTVAVRSPGGHHREVRVLAVADHG